MQRDTVPDGFMFDEVSAVTYTSSYFTVQTTLFKMPRTRKHYSRSWSHSRTASRSRSRSRSRTPSYSRSSSHERALKRHRHVDICDSPYKASYRFVVCCCRRVMGIGYKI
ncbi:serine/arginine-rich splicing factor 5-like [Thrips palmi]|uniref:Serine/arginine-rich splicing factor 5-like n=1 Tax=Thrips palmi TaxID=161013 RepID=A0A6P8ZXF2_THRPL|nr:serine/arginine-rich splicing factor 5-like [Thrips palmi]